MSGLRDRLSSGSDTVKQKAKMAAVQAKMAGSDAKASVKQRVEDADTEKIKQQLAEVADGPENSDVGSDRRDETLEGAEEAATMAGPVDADLSPTTSPQDVDGAVDGSMDGGSAMEEDAPMGVGVESGFFAMGGDGDAPDSMLGLGSGDNERDDPDDLLGFGGGMGDEPEDDLFNFGMSDEDDDREDSLFEY